MIRHRKMAQLIGKLVLIRMDEDSFLRKIRLQGLNPEHLVRNVFYWPNRQGNALFRRFPHKDFREKFLELDCFDRPGKAIISSLQGDNVLDYAVGMAFSYPGFQNVKPHCLAAQASYQNCRRIAAGSSLAKGRIASPETQKRLRQFLPVIYDICER